MSDKPDLSELFQMLAEEKAKTAEKQEKKKKKSKEYQKDFMEAFSQELKKLKEEEEQQKRDVAAMEAWLTSPVVEKNEEPELEVEVADEPVASAEQVTEEELEAVEQVLEEDKEILEALAETPLQEQALQYLNDKREELSEEAKQIKSMQKEMASVNDQLKKLRMLMQNTGGGGIAKIRQADDIDKTTALVNNKFLKYDSSTGKFVGADASGGGGGISNVVEDTTPQLGGNLDLNSNDITGTGDIDITGEVTANEFIGEFRGPLIFKAKADGALSKGDVVYVSGISGNTPTVAKADADDATKMPAFGLAHDAASNNSSVDIVTFGTLSGLDTSSFTVGDTLYVSTTAGAITNSAPAGESSYIQNIGKVQRAHASAGSIKVGGAGRFNATGNLNDGNIFIGNSSNQASTASLETEVESLLGSVGVSIVPDTTETYDLGSSSLRWNELFLAGQTIDLGGTKITKDANGDVELKDGSDNLKRIKVEEIEIGSGNNRIKLTKSNNGKLEIKDKDNGRASHDVAFSEITSTPTTISGYGITDAFDGAYSSLTGTPTIPTDVSDLTDDSSLLGGGGISLTSISVNPVEGTASGDGGLAYNNLTGVFTYTPPDLSSYLTSYTVTSADVTAHEADITITESQISDLQSYLTSYTVTESDVTAHQAALSITESQISDLQSYLTSVSEAAVTAHEAALTITESQISDLGSYATLASPTLTGTPAAPTAATGTDTTQIATTAFVQQEITALKALLYAIDSE